MVSILLVKVNVSNVVLVLGWGGKKYPFFFTVKIHGLPGGGGKKYPFYLVSFRSGLYTNVVVRMIRMVNLVLLVSKNLNKVNNNQNHYLNQVQSPG